MLPPRLSKPSGPFAVLFYRQLEADLPLAMQVDRHRFRNQLKAIQAFAIQTKIPFMQGNTMIPDNPSYMNLLIQKFILF